MDAIRAGLGKGWAVFISGGPQSGHWARPGGSVYHRLPPGARRLSPHKWKYKDEYKQRKLAVGAKIEPSFDEEKDKTVTTLLLIAMPRMAMAMKATIDQVKNLENKRYEGI